MSDYRKVSHRPSYLAMGRATDGTTITVGFDYKGFFVDKDGAKRRIDRSAVQSWVARAKALGGFRHA